MKRNLTAVFQFSAVVAVAFLPARRPAKKRSKHSAHNLPSHRTSNRSRSTLHHRLRGSLSPSRTAAQHAPQNRARFLQPVRPARRRSLCRSSLLVLRSHRRRCDLALQLLVCRLPIHGLLIYTRNHRVANDLCPLLRCNWTDLAVRRVNQGLSTPGIPFSSSSDTSASPTPSCVITCSTSSFGFERKVCAAAVTAF